MQYKSKILRDIKLKIGISKTILYNLHHTSQHLTETVILVSQLFFFKMTATGP